ncbi:SMC family ATPase [Frankia sp. AiPs1]|uniref:AAA family ATPase n=1 Tax=Frankia sp. AiPs1 TaxID=573493 RepID=UPI0020435CFB|nr:SMC family ATPase [Frankia sp. AiPs1]MCM3920127.1 SMC family ATPase [Frankia sp. AiPs1]
MRPLSLSLRGLRSYLAEQEIDFSSVGLIAIHGDTGAGKSSLLEALYFALYGGSTWDGRNASELIADGAATMRVRLTFRCADKTWQVTRTISRSSSPPSRHELLCLDDGTRHDSRTEVNTVIEKMIGLDYRAFLKTVILPQGRFQALLYATPKDRTEILKSVLGLDQLDTIRNTAQISHERLHHLLTQRIIERQKLLDDPPAAAAAATRRLHDAGQREAQFTDARDTARGAAARRDGLLARATAAGRQEELLQAARQPTAAAVLGALASLEKEIRGEQKTCQDATTEWQRREGALQDTVDEAERQGRGPSILPRAIAIVETAREQLPNIDTDRNRIEAADLRLAEDRRVVDEHAAGLVERATVVGEAEEAARSAADSVAASRELVASQLAVVASAQSLRIALHGTESEVEGARLRIKQAEAAMEESAAQLGAAKERQIAADQVLEAVMRSNSAAHAAAACQPGQPCPVCSRDLPITFQPPPEREVGEARAVLATATAAAKEIEGRHGAAVLSRRNAIEDVERLEPRAVAERQKLALVVDRLAPQLRAVDLDQPADAVVLPLLTICVAEEEGLEEQGKVAAASRESLAVEAAKVDQSRRALAGRQDSLTADRLALDQRLRASVGKLEELPELWRLDPVTVEGLDLLLGTAREWEVELKAVTDQLTAARAQIGELGDLQARLDTRHLTEVERPVTKLLHALDELVRRASETALLVGHQPPPPRSPDDELPTSVTWAAALEDTVAVLLRAARDEAATATSQARQADDEITEVLSAAGVDAMEQFDRLIIEAAAAAMVAQTDLDRAERETPIASDLDRRIEAATPLVDALRELSTLLAAGRFQAAVVARRQRALLGLATDQLLAMTAGRFAFSPDFRIIDRHTSQPRDGRTLSGGETFLASLALALAVVDLAGRAGGRADALLLDEGFGSLDADTLAEALAALSRQTLGGRLVAVISHMRAVAENIGDVLLVTRDESGSQAHWASMLERGRLVDEDLDGGLLP